MTGSLSYDSARRKAKVRVYIGRDPRTHRELVRSKTFTAKNEQEAKRLANGHVATILAGAEVEAAQRGTVAEAVDRWNALQESLGRSPATIYRNRSITRRLVASYGTRPLTEFTARDVHDWFAELRRTTYQGRLLSESTVHHHHRVLSSILHLAQIEGVAGPPVTKAAIKPKPDKPEMLLPTDEVLEMLVSTLPSAVWLPIMLEATTGLRRGEVVALRWGDIDGNKLHVRQAVVEVPKQPLHFKAPKGRATRTVDLTAETVALLWIRHDELCEAADEVGAVFAADARMFPDMPRDPTGRTPVKPSWLSDQWEAHCRRNGIHVRLHALRHWAATTWLNNGVSIKKVQEMLGHTLASTTMNMYAHAEPDSDKARSVMAGRFIPQPALTIVSNE